MKLDNIDKILIIKLDHIGDMILATPLFKAIKLRYPNLYIDVMISERTVEVLEYSPYIRNIYIYESSDYDRNGIRDEEVVSENIKTIHKIRNEKYEVCINLRDDGKNIMIQNLLNIKTTISYYNDTPYPELLDISINNNKKKHALYSDFELLNIIDVRKTNNIETEIFLSEEDIKWKEEFIIQNKISNTDILIGVSMGGGWKLNWWPQDKYKKLCQSLLLYDEKIKIVFVGGKIEENIFQWVSNQERYISVMGKTNIRQLAALAQRFDVIVTNDGGPMHIMSTAKKPLIALFGPSPDYRYAPIGDNVIVINKRLKCSPCPQYTTNNAVLCENNLCMQQISVEEVYKFIVEEIKKVKR